MKSPKKNKQVLNVACWNVRTMLNTANSNHPEHRSALVAHELSCLTIDKAALSEVHFADEGSLKEHRTGLTLFWSGKPSNERHQSGVGLMVRNSIASKLNGLPTGHSDRIMSMHLPLQGKQHFTLFSVYAPTLLADAVDRSSLLATLMQELERTPKLGKDPKAWKGVLGRHGTGNCNNKGRLLLELCTEHQFVITNTLPTKKQQKDSQKTA